MQPSTLLPDPELVRLDYVSAEADLLTMVVSSRRCAVECPDCQQLARRVHSRYQRRLADRPWNGIRVRLQLHAHRWFCDRPECSRRIFTERFPGLTRRYAYRTEAQTQTLQLIAYALGGEAGARLARDVGMPASPDTLLRQLRRRGPFTGRAPRVLGVDDWAFLKGQRYGTVLVDLEGGEAVDLLPDRAAETLAAWLKEHPGAEVISRDRATSYAEGARQGAPDAIQVADRFHLLKNLTDALGEVLGREHAALRKAAQDPAPDPAAAGCRREAAASIDEEPAVPAPPPKVPDRRSRRERERSAHSRERRLARYEETIRLRGEGLSARQIARRLGISATTVNKDLAAGAFPERKSAAPKTSPVEPYAAYLRQRWEEGCHNAKQLWRELREQGFTGGFVSVWRFTRGWHDNPADASLGAAPARDPSVPAHPAPRSVVWWLLCPKKRTEAQTAFVERLEQENSKIRLAHELVAEFFGLVRERKPEGLADWMARAEASKLPDLVGFCRGVRRDWEAVVAGLTMEWSNGPVEGQVNRLKLIKRQMYGRASFALLRARVLRPG
jgi:transposase